MSVPTLQQLSMARLPAFAENNHERRFWRHRETLKLGKRVHELHSNISDVHTTERKQTWQLDRLKCRLKRQKRFVGLMAKFHDNVDSNKIQLVLQEDETRTTTKIARLQAELHQLSKEKHNLEMHLQQIYDLFRGCARGLQNVATEDWSVLPGYYADADTLALTVIVRLDDMRVYSTFMCQRSLRDLKPLWTTLLRQQDVPGYQDEGRLQSEVMREFSQGDVDNEQTSTIMMDNPYLTYTAVIKAQVLMQEMHAFLTHADASVLLIDEQRTGVVITMDSGRFLYCTKKTQPLPGMMISTNPLMYAEKLKVPTNQWQDFDPCRRAITGALKVLNRAIERKL